MTVFILGVLKIIGLILLAVLGLIVLLILLVLLVPVRYQAEGAFLEKHPKGRAGGSWLLHALSVQAVYEDQFDLVIRVLGIRIGGRKKAAPEDSVEKESQAEGKVQKKDENKKEEPVVSEPVVPEPAISEPVIPEPAISEPAAEAPEARKKEDHRPKNDVPKSAEPEEKKGIFQRIRGKWESLHDKITGKLQELRQKFLDLKEKKEKLQNFLQDENNKKTLALAKRQLFRLVRHILPRRMTGWFRFGFDDPYTTGRVLTILSPFYGLYADKVKLIPVFEESVLEGELQLKGRIRIGTVLVTAGRMLLDKNFRKILKKLWKA